MTWRDCAPRSWSTTLPPLKMNRAGDALNAVLARELGLGIDIDLDDLRGGAQLGRNCVQLGGRRGGTGPHQVAQKSTRTGTSEDSTSLSKSAAR